MSRVDSSFRNRAIAGLLLLTVSLAWALWPGVLRVAHASDQDAERAIRDLEAQWAQAVLAGNRAFYETALADDFTHTSHTGRFKTRAQWLAEDKTGAGQNDAKPGQTRYTAYRLDDLAVRIYGDTAVVTGRTTPAGHDAKGQPITGQFRYIRVWVKHNGRWQAVAFEGTRIAQP
jgi:ketosteroid isomerase-like protein